MTTYGTWATQVILAVALRAGVEPENYRAPDNAWWLCSWAALEDTRARYNPLATTLSMEGDSTFNGAGVKNYCDLGSGVYAAAATLVSEQHRPYRPSGAAAEKDQQRGYARIVNLLLDDDSSFEDFAEAVSRSAWSGEPRDGKHYRIRSEKEGRALLGRPLPGT